MENTATPLPSATPGGTGRTCQPTVMTRHTRYTRYTRYTRTCQPTVMKTARTIALASPLMSRAAPCVTGVTGVTGAP
eukprot:7261528-Prymnesium_polylepis.3